MNEKIPINKLEPQHKHIIKLIARDRDAEGWTNVSDALYPVLSQNMPREIVEFEASNNGWRARLTSEGENVLAAMEWL